MIRSSDNENAPGLNQQPSNKLLQKQRLKSSTVIKKGSERQDHNDKSHEKEEEASIDGTIMNMESQNAGKGLFTQGADALTVSEDV